jgi:hypothetical protein
MALFGKIFIFCDFETDSFGFSCHDMKTEVNEYSRGTNHKKTVLLTMLNIAVQNSHYISTQSL